MIAGLDKPDAGTVETIDDAHSTSRDREERGSQIAPLRSRLVFARSRRGDRKSPTSFRMLIYSRGEMSCETSPCPWSCRAFPNASGSMPRTTRSLRSASQILPTAIPPSFRAAWRMRVYCASARHRSALASLDEPFAALDEITRG